MHFRRRHGRRGTGKRTGFPESHPCHARGPGASRAITQWRWCGVRKICCARSKDDSRATRHQSQDRRCFPQRSGSDVHCSRPWTQGRSDVTGRKTGHCGARSIPVPGIGGSPYAAQRNTGNPVAPSPRIPLRCIQATFAAGTAIRAQASLPAQRLAIRPLRARVGISVAAVAAGR